MSTADFSMEREEPIPRVAHQSGWQYALPYLQQFHQAWWGQKDLLNDFVNTNSTPPKHISVPFELCALVDATMTKILLRPEIIRMFIRLREAYEEGGNDVMLSGQPNNSFNTYNPPANIDNLSEEIFWRGQDRKRRGAKIPAMEQLSHSRAWLAGYLEYTTQEKCPENTSKNDPNSDGRTFAIHIGLQGIRDCS
ncbi:hypothetical protein GYMLUDRAFT_58912 [Collybiopsis luxurians FD-317 M1]|uniref:Uncharacterized protein n=1 Tax=Collybiopsis luxurians FD-317 M1 TaxID=944289 RepID=A0A0D0BCF9_9AGAR|nr:hypothetical protein GYMLUDRAFT_58912 [Collybiopsis luxurians FD-317 M1]